MSIKKNRKKIICLISSVLCVATGYLVSESQVNAQVSIVEYNFKGVSDAYKDSETPPAYRIYGSPYFNDGTIMYKNSYRGVTYYSPKPPAQNQEALLESREYLNWGFWDFTLNNNTIHNGAVIGDDVLFESSIHYEQAKIKRNTSVQGVKVGDHTNTYYNLGTIPAGTIVDVLSVTNYGETRVYFSLHGLKDINGNPLLKDGYLDVGRVPVGYVEPIGPTKKIYFPESANRKNPARKVYDNFKPYSKKAQFLNDSSHKNLEASTFQVPNLSYDPYGISGKFGEWRYLGVNAQGQPVPNPYFPSDSLHFTGNTGMKYYNWRQTPWDESDAESGERATYSGQERLNLLKQDADAFKMEFGQPGAYNGPSYWNDKKSIIQNFVNSGELEGNIDRVTNQFMLTTNPRRDTAIFVGQQKNNTVSRRVVYLTELRDLYIHSIVVKDTRGNTVATGYGDLNGNFNVSNGSVPLKRGGQYVASIVIANGSNSPMIKNTLQANFGYAYDNNTFDSKRPLYNLPFRDSMSIGNKGGLTSVIHSTSSEFQFSFNIPSDYNKSFIDLYGYVGESHTGVDNLNYSNDTGSMRLNVSSEPYNPPGDIEVSKIELIDSKGEVVFRKNADGSEPIKKAPKPGQSYSIKYTAKYTGEDKLYFEWVPPVEDNPNTDINEFRPGYFKDPVLLKYEVPVEYKYVRKVKDTISDDAVLKNDKFRDSNGNTSIPMSKNTEMTYTIPNVMFEHPYISTYFKITSTNTEINSSTVNDYLHASVNDVYDIEIKNVKIIPQTEYIGSENKEMNYTVTYEAVLTTPDYVTANDYRTQVNTSINVNGTTVNVIDQIQVGLNTGLSHQVSNVPVDSNLDSVIANVVLNFDKASYESGNYENNVGNASSSLDKIKDPMDGKADDTASRPDNSNNNNKPNRGGDANNNCLVPRTSNKWTNAYKVKNWNATPVTYKINSTGASHTFYKYNVVSNETENVTSRENFEITKVLFKSKSTVDKKLGQNKDGWVELSKASEKDLGLIKAGYGFELKVVTEYRTNALLNNPTWSVNKTTGGKTVLNLNGGLNFNPDIFIELPGDANSRKILSVSGYASSLKGLQVKQTKSGVKEGSGSNAMEVYEWEYTIKPSKTVGLVETGKVYIPQNLKDGDYKISIYTPPVTGASSLNELQTSKYSALCDRKDVKVKVKGSSTDDLNSHVTQ